MAAIARRIVQSSLPRMSINVAPPIRLINRSLIIMSQDGSARNNTKLTSSMMCSCGCGGRGFHTNGDKEFINFLESEISTEKSNLEAVPSSLGDFKITSSEAELNLTRKFHNEEVKVSMNINHSAVDEGQDAIVCKPNFEVDMKVGSKTLSVTCEFTEPEEGEQNPGPFGISELVIFDGEFTESKYCLSGDIMDPMMYDLLLNMLEERGVDDGFAQQLSDLATAYDHKCYVDLLQNVNNFIKNK